MIQSMTGFGKHAAELPTKKITVEIKSLNSKNLDINARMPQAYREKELELRKRISESLNRGKIDFNLNVEFTGNEAGSVINKEVVESYIKQLSTIQKGDRIQLMEMALRLPDVLKTDKADLDDSEYSGILASLNAALAEINAYRTEEGAVLQQEFEKRVIKIKDLLTQVEKMDPLRQLEIRQRLEKAVQDLKAEVDANRFEQELIYYLEKYDITEEKVRLENHLQYFEKSLCSADSNGKKLGFISQEIGREINTIGSKANYAPMQQLVVQMKEELEKIKEQLLNVL